MANFGVELRDAANQVWTENDWISQVRLIETISSSKTYHLNHYMAKPENGFAIVNVLDYTPPYGEDANIEHYKTPTVKRENNSIIVSNSHKMNIQVIIGEQNG